MPDNQKYAVRPMGPNDTTIEIVLLKDSTLPEDSLWSPDNYTVVRLFVPNTRKSFDCANAYVCRLNRELGIYPANESSSLVISIPVTDTSDNMMSTDGYQPMGPWFVRHNEKFGGFDVRCIYGSGTAVVTVHFVSSLSSKEDAERVALELNTRNIIVPINCFAYINI